MKRFPILSGLFFTLSIASSCGITDNKKSVAIKDFPERIILEGKPVLFDTIPGMIGMVQKVDSSYYHYLYKSDHLLMKTDTDFKRSLFLCRKGDGPDELMAISGTYGDILDNGGVGIIDPYKFRLYRLNEKDNDHSLDLIHDFHKSVPYLQVRYVLQPSDSDFIIVPGTYEYGLYYYSLKDNTPEKWDIGYNFGDQKHPIQEITSFRVIAFNRKRNIVGEVYGGLPVLILHDMDGNVINRISFGRIPDVNDINPETTDPFADIKLTDNYIYIFYRENEENDHNRILVTDYDGKPIVEMVVEAAYTFEIDTELRRIICVNPEKDEGNVMIYPIPPSIVNP